MRSTSSTMLAIFGAAACGPQTLLLLLWGNGASFTSSWESLVSPDGRRLSKVRPLVVLGLAATNDLALSMLFILKSIATLAEMALITTIHVEQQQRPNNY
jgi:hypothetical protein